MKHTEELAQAGRIQRESHRALMETANATRPNLAEMNRRADERILDCLSACIGIANPSAIPALIEAIQYHFSAMPVQVQACMDALDAEPVA